MKGLRGIFIVSVLTYPCLGTASRIEGDADPFLTGTLSLNGKVYKAVCNCAEGASDLELKATEVAPSCNPSKVKIHQDHAGASGLTAAEVREGWGQAADVSFGKISDYHFSCLDDRITEQSLGTPGGDLGEFTLALAVSGGNYDEATATSILNSYLASTPSQRHFYYCTDDDALNHLEKSLDTEGLNITDPNPLLQNDIKIALAQARNIGDSHFRSMTRNPTWYHVEKELPSTAQKAFLNVLWDKNNPNRKKMILDILTGQRNPRAFLEVATTQDCEMSGVAPLMKPKTKASQVLISHLNAVNSRRKELAEFFTRNGFSPLPAEEFRSRMDRYGFQWLETSGARLAKDIPFYRVTFV